MPSFKIEKGKDGMYRTRVFSSPDANGKRISKRITGYTEREVRKLAEDFLDEMKRQPKAFRMTLKDAAMKYIDYLENKKKPISPSTSRLYHNIVKNYFTSLHNVPLISITEEMIQDEIYELEQKVSAKTIHNIINFYVPCIRHSRRGFRPELDLPDLQKPITKIPDMSELRGKINTIQNKRLKIPVLLAAYCGMRRSEIAALDLNNDIEYDKQIEFDNKIYNVCIIHINKAVVMDKEQQYVMKSTKSEAGVRDLFVPEWLGEILKDARDDPSYNPYPPHKISSRFYEWAKSQNIECGFHGLRHFYASIMKAINIPDNYAMLLMGHSTNNMLQRYQEIMHERELQVNQDLLDYLNENAPMHHQSAPPNTINQE